MADLFWGMAGPPDLDEGSHSAVVRKGAVSSAVAEEPEESPHSISLKRFKGRRGEVNEDLGQENRNSSLMMMKCFEDYLHECCRLGLQVDEFRLQQAVELFRKIKCPLLANLDATDSGRAIEPIWGACVLYVVKRLGVVPSAGQRKDCSCFTLSQLLQITKLSVVDFFKELAQFFAKVGTTVKSLFGDDCERRLQIRESQTNFVHLVVLFNYYKRVYQDYFLSLECTTVSWRGSKFSVHMQFGWMLFLVLRMRVLPQFTDLVTCTNGLLAVMTIMIHHMPAHLKKISCEDPSKFSVRTAGGVDVIASLCHLYHASEKDVSDLVENAGSMVQEVFHKSSVTLSTSRGRQILGVDTEGLPYFEGLMEDLNLMSHIQVLESDYEGFHRSQGELDERVFIRDDNTLIGAMSLSSLSVSGVKRKFDVMSSPNRTTTVASPLGTVRSPCSSPLKGESAVVTSGKMPPPTPVSTTMTTAKWFRTVIAPLPSDPSAELQQAFRSCDHDVSEKIRSRLQVLIGAIFPCNDKGNWHILGEVKGGTLLDSSWAEQRRLEATKLYYKVLGAMCRSEVRRQPGCNLTALLTNEKFHRCMISCSAELVLAAHKTVTITFSAVLESTGISAFDLSKVIEGFVRYEETLPRELKRHLNSLEERLLESMAWEKGSSMYSSLVVAKASLSAEINRLCLLPDPQLPLDIQPSAMFQQTIGTTSIDDGAGGLGSPPRSSVPPSGKSVSAIMSSVGELGISCFKSPAKERASAFSAFASPVKGRVQASLHSQFASPHKPGSLGGGETCAEIVINVFFQKVLKLAANRIRSLCERLQLSSQVMDHVYSTMRQMLHRGTTVFFNRHIDQLILCSIYGVCKVSRVNVTFRDIIFQYRKQPQCKPHVFRNVFIDSPVRRTEKPGGPDTGDVIRFYNEVFVPTAKGFLLPISQNGPFSLSACAHIDSTDKCEGKPSEASEPATFPTLPNMSPKKVSATHNVYVSPLRGMKMDFIMSPHTRSLYACVGESTHEYQSPSKDLSAINSRLNSRLNSRRLDFSDIASVREMNPPAATVDAGVDQAGHPNEL